jgi:hypothetical protein
MNIYIHLYHQINKINSFSGRAAEMQPKPVDAIFYRNKPYRTEKKIDDIMFSYYSNTIII